MKPSCFSPVYQETSTRSSDPSRFFSGIHLEPRPRFCCIALNDLRHSWRFKRLNFFLVTPFDPRKVAPVCVSSKATVQIEGAKQAEAEFQFIEFLESRTKRDP